MILFDSADEAPETPRVPVPLIVRIPIEWDVSDILNDFEEKSPITSRSWPNERA